MSSPLDSKQRIVGAGLKAVAKRGCREFRKLYRIDAQAITQFRGKHPAAEHRKTGERKAFGPPDIATSDGAAIAPGRAGAGSEQHADDGKIEFRACARRNARPTRRCGSRDPAIVAVDREVPPARMEWNFKRRIGFTGDRDGEIGGLFQSMQIDVKIVEPGGETSVPDDVRTLADRGCRQQR